MVDFSVWAEPWNSAYFLKASSKTKLEVGLQTIIIGWHLKVTNENTIHTIAATGTHS